MEMVVLTHRAVWGVVQQRRSPSDTVPPVRLSSSPRPMSEVCCLSYLPSAVPTGVSLQDLCLRHVGFPAQKVTGVSVLTLGSFFGLKAGLEGYRAAGRGPTGR